MPSHKVQGFTLVELVIVVAIISILAAIAIPNYQEYVRRGHRAAAKAVLMDNVQFLERNFTANNCYHRTDGACSTAAVTIALPKTQAPETGTARYNISFAGGSPTANAYSIIATPTGSMTGDDCGTLTINQLGQQGITSLPAGSTKTAAQCWPR